VSYAGGGGVLMQRTGLPTEACDEYTHCPYPAHSSCQKPQVRADFFMRPCLVQWVVGRSCVAHVSVGAQPPSGGHCDFTNGSTFSGAPMFSFGADNYQVRGWVIYPITQNWRL
jgi:hypothetical protein